MRDRLDAWRARLLGDTSAVEGSVAGTDGSERGAPTTPKLVPETRLAQYGPCGVCSGPREVRMTPVGEDAARMTLACSTCGAETAI